MRTFLISDTHFGHRSILKLSEEHEPRPFRSVDDMDKTLIKNWNSVVSKGDTVFHLGDFSLCDFDKTQEIFKRLNGRIHLIMGNHCKRRSENWFKNVGFYQIYKYPICYEKFFWLSHEPMALDKNSIYVNIHGHIHSPGRMKQYDKIISANHHINICAEMINYTPILLDDIIKESPGDHQVRKREEFRNLK